MLHRSSFVFLLTFGISACMGRTPYLGDKVSVTLNILLFNRKVPAIAGLSVKFLPAREACNYPHQPLGGAHFITASGEGLDSRDTRISPLSGSESSDIA